jgi:DNA-binding transcriptional MocR family regulator
MPAERKRQLYSVCSEFDLLLLEDDPYYFMQYDNADWEQSFLSMDTEARVIRFDSFSKVSS